MRDNTRIQNELRLVWQVLVEFSARLDFTLSRGATLSEFHRELFDLGHDMRDFIQSESSNKQQTGESDMIDTNSMRRTLSESRIRCNELSRENSALRVASPGHYIPVRGSALSPVSTRAETEEDDSSWIRDRIRLLKSNLAERNLKMEELRNQHEHEIKKIESLHQKEVQSLRDALASTYRILERWKTIYTDDVSRLKEALSKKSTGSRYSTLSKSKSSERLTKPCMN